MGCGFDYAQPAVVTDTEFYIQTLSVVEGWLVRYLEDSGRLLLVGWAAWLWLLGCVAAWLVMKTKIPAIARIGNKAGMGITKR